MFREGKPEIEKPQLKATAASTDLTTIKQSELLKAVSKTHAEKIVLKEAPPEYEFIADPPSISGKINLFSTSASKQFTFQLLTWMW